MGGVGRRRGSRKGRGGRGRLRSGGKQVKRQTAAGGEKGGGKRGEGNWQGKGGRFSRKKVDPIRHKTSKGQGKVMWEMKSLFHQGRNGSWQEERHGEGDIGEKTSGRKIWKPKSAGLEGGKRPQTKKGRGGKKRKGQKKQKGGKGSFWVRNFE